MCCGLGSAGRQFPPFRNIPANIVYKLRISKYFIVTSILPIYNFAVVCVYLSVYFFNVKVNLAVVIFNTLYLKLKPKNNATNKNNPILL